MSAVNGDKARFNRRRRAKISRRKRNEEMISSLAAKNLTAPPLQTLASTQHSANNHES